MTTEYTIYLVNHSTKTQTFWCFLDRPQELVDDPGVFANSSTNLTVGSYQPGNNTFTIPVQYVVGAGASNNAVGLDIEIKSSIINNADLTDTWEADYVTVPPQQGPTMQKLNMKSPANTIAIESNKFDQAKNEGQQWFANMSFGIQTNQGFMGMSWSPSPQQTRTLTPELKFYVSIGSYGKNTLASWNTVSNNSAEIKVPSSFLYNETTVTYTSTGDWVITPGKPSNQLLAGGHKYLGSLIQSHLFISKAHADLVALAQPDLVALVQGSNDFTNQTDTLVSVHWDSDLEAGEEEEAEFIVLTGTLTVTAALTAAFAYFILSGVKFSIDRAPVGGTTVHFSYSGKESAQAIKDLFVAGAKLFFGNN